MTLRVLAMKPHSLSIKAIKQTETQNNYDIYLALQDHNTLTFMDLLLVVEIDWYMTF